MIFDADLSVIKNLDHLTIIAQPVAPLGVNCVFLISSKTRHTAIIDPGGSEILLKSIITNHSLKPQKILLTHGHFDHIGAVDDLCEYSVPNIKNPALMIHREDEEFLRRADQSALKFGLRMEPVHSSVTEYLTDGQIIMIDDIEIHVIHTPGHSRGSVCFYLPREGYLISGDTLFEEGIGRTDLPGGSYETLLESIQGKLFALPDNVTVIPGHGDFTTIGHEKTGNPYASIGAPV